MRVTRTIAAWCFLACLPVSCALAQGLTGQLSDLHVDPQDSKVGVRVSFTSTQNKPIASPEAIKTLDELVKVNGFELQPATPWHLELSYDEFDEDGDNVHSGTVDEFYVNPKKYRKVIKTDEFNQTEITNGSDLYRVGDQNWPPQATSQAIREIVLPLYESTTPTDTSPDKLNWTVGGTKLPCVVLRNSRVISENGLKKFCYEPGTTILRYTRGSGWDETVYNGIFHLGQRYLARDVEVTHAGKPFLKIHLDKAEAVSQLDDSLFSPPPGAAPLTGVVSVPSAVLMKEYLLQREFPSHLPKGVHGKVTVKFTVNKEGHVVQVQATDGPEELRKAVEEDVMKWQFRPFLILDKPVEVESTTFYDIR